MPAAAVTAAGARRLTRPALRARSGRLRSISPTARTSTPRTAGRRSSPTSGAVRAGAEAAASRRPRRSASACGCRRATRASCSTATARRVPSLSRRAKDCTSRSSTAFPTARSIGRPSKPRSTRRTGATRSASRYTLDLIEILARCCRTASTAASRRRRLSYKAWMAAGTPIDREPFGRNVVGRRRSAGAGRGRNADDSSISTSSLNRTASSRRPTRRSRSSRSAAADRGARWLAQLGRRMPDQARAHLVDHVRVCFDCCHFAVEHEDPRRGARSLRRPGVKVGRVQLSSALRCAFPGDRDGVRRAIVERLRPLRRRDLPPSGRRTRAGRRCATSPISTSRSIASASPAAASGAFISMSRCSPASTTASDSTQDDVREVLDAGAATPVHAAPRNRDLHMGRAARRAEDRSAGLDRAGVPVGVE